MNKPKEIDIGLEIDCKKLWDLDIPEEEIDISLLEYNMDLPYLEQEGTDDWNLTPRMLIKNFKKEISHAKKVNEADLSYPIEIYFHNDRWIILEGVHRYTKSVKDGLKTIKVRKVPESLIHKVKRGS